MTASRVVAWGGIHNARDLGGLNGRLGTTVAGRVYRMPRPDPLDESGWGELQAAGVRTIIDLRNDDEVRALPLRPAELRVERAPIEDPLDSEFLAMFPHLGSPAHYAENLRRWPLKVATAIAAIADAPGGGVVFHCSAGRDRTGLIAALVLDLVGVDRGSILDDYESGMRETNAHLATLEYHHEKPRTVAALDEAVTDARRSLDALLGSLDVERYLLAAGLSPAQLEALRRRLLEP